MSSKSAYPNNPFVPKPYDILNIHKTTVSLYPKLTDDMSPNEKSYGLLVTKNALETADIPVNTRLQQLGQRTDCVHTVTTLMNRYISHANYFVRQNKNFSVLSYHDKTGRVVPNAVNPATGLLYETDLVNPADRRPAGVMYAKLHCNIAFQDLHDAYKTKHPIDYYISLPQDSRMVKDANSSNDTQLTTFFGRSDWAENAAQGEVDLMWDGPEQVNLPFILQPPLISTDRHADAIVQIEPMTRVIKNIALEACWMETVL